MNAAKAMLAAIAALVAIETPPILWVVRVESRLARIEERLEIAPGAAARPPASSSPATVI